MASNKLTCASHGEQPCAYVCQHIYKSLQTGKACGYYWSRDEEHQINAWCANCDDYLERHGGEWNEMTGKFAQIKLLCEGCALAAAELNGVEVIG